ncbi:MAG: hypothetical protein IT436_04635 [Phycisphaerales bacterium]|nr:hypothetical protein [Phycisphaerales bacterium]
MIDHPPTRAELVDVLLNSRAVSDATRRGVCAALGGARERGRTVPNVRDCVQACIDTGASLGPVCGAWGYVRDRDNVGEWLNARAARVEPGSVGVFATNESLACFMAFCLFCNVSIPFSFEFTKRRPPRRPR